MAARQKLKTLVNNGESEHIPDYLKVTNRECNSKKRFPGEERRHFVTRAWGVS